MQKSIAHTARMVFQAAEAGVRSPFSAVLDAARTQAQELPTPGRRRAAIARSRREFDAHFAALNADDGLLVPASQRPAGRMWRLHPAPDAVELAGTPAGAALALSVPGARP
jgi:hypothetical protein